MHHENKLSNVMHSELFSQETITENPVLMSYDFEEYTIICIYSLY